ncbi:MAG: hypothetical protein HQL19_01090 [Candidatus Omnitrophica bacterium]|nr:hypothetical protein [Candidatus Omnitrophota bacterium]
MKKLRVLLSGFLWAGLSMYSMVWAQSSGAEDKASEEFNGLATFMVKVMTGPVSKVLALVFLIVAIWNIVHKQYGVAIGCVMALLALVFLPNFLSIF